MKEGEKFEEGMEQGRQEGRAEGLSGETGMSEAFEMLLKGKTGTMLMRTI